jgi:hypothetical protein
MPALTIEDKTLEQGLKVFEASMKVVYGK